MAQPKLSTTTSVVDFLKSKGQQSSFAARRKLFNEKGFNTRLGEFTGARNQNLALLRNLQTPPPVDTGAAAALENIARPVTTGPTGVPLPIKGRGTETQSVSLPITGERPDAPPVPLAEPTFTQQIEERVPQAGEQFQLTDIPTPTAPSAGDILTRARGETGVQLAEEEARTAKNRIQEEVQPAIEDVRADFATRGLVFSGARNTAEQEVRDQAIADKFDVDLKFAKILGTAIDRAATDLGKEIEEVIDDAKAKREDEVAFLADLGLAVNPQTGELFQTLASLREQRLDEAEPTPRTQVRSIGGRQLLIDLNTGDVVRDLGKSKDTDGPEDQPEFTSSERKKLEQAGLQDAEREEKLDFLFGEGQEISREAKREAQFEDARAIAKANIEEKIFGKTGKLKKDVTQEELENSIRQVTGLGIGDTRRIIEEVLAIKDIGEEE